MKHLTIGIDPGIRGTSYARFCDGVLEACGYVKNPIKEGNGPEACAAVAAAVYAVLDVRNTTSIVFEWPRIYSRAAGKTKGDPNDMLALCGIDGAIAALAYGVGGFGVKISHVEPAQWKGTLTKEACAARVRDRFKNTLSEAMVLGAALERVAPSLQHNVLDACGIGLHALGRFERVRAIARRSDISDGETKKIKK